MKTGAKILVESLSLHGVRRASSVAGESYLAVLDALLDHPEIELITNRQEGGAAFMAESWGKLTGQPGICFVTRGPGACNASIGVHTAMQDSTPMILFMGQVGRGEMGREAFQEISVPQVFGGLAKWATEILDAHRIPEIIYRAFKTATSGRPGPVVIGLPEDVLTEKVACDLTAPYQNMSPYASRESLRGLRELLEQSRRPVAIVGGSGWTDEICTSFQRFAENHALPVAASFRRQDLFDHNSPCYIGELGTGPNPKLVEKIKEADLLLVMGARLNEITTQGYTLPEAPTPKQKLIHIYPADQELGKVYVPTLGIQGEMRGIVTALGDSNMQSRDWLDWKNELRRLYEDWTAIDLAKQPAWNGANMTAIFAFLRDNLPEDAIITTDAGNFSGWAQRYLRYGRPGRLLAPISGAMGYAVPSAIGASLAAPDKCVVGICGDGGFMMTGQELATAIHHGAKPIILICNNSMYGTIRMHQERAYPGRTNATALTNPDFTVLAKSYGAFAACITDAKDFPAAWEKARAAGKAAILEIRMDPRQLTTRATL